MAPGQTARNTIDLTVDSDAEDGATPETGANILAIFKRSEHKPSATGNGTGRNNSVKRELPVLPVLAPRPMTGSTASHHRTPNSLPSASNPSNRNNIGSSAPRDPPNRAHEMNKSQKRRRDGTHVPNPALHSIQRAASKGTHNPTPALNSIQRAVSKGTNIPTEANGHSRRWKMTNGTNGKSKEMKSSEAKGTETTAKSEVSRQFSMGLKRSANEAQAKDGRTSFTSLFSRASDEDEDELTIDDRLARAIPATRPSSAKEQGPPTKRKRMNVYTAGRTVSPDPTGGPSPAEKAKILERVRNLVPPGSRPQPDMRESILEAACKLVPPGYVKQSMEESILAEVNKLFPSSVPRPRPQALPHPEAMRGNGQHQRPMSRNGISKSFTAAIQTSKSSSPLSEVFTPTSEYSHDRIGSSKQPGPHGSVASRGHISQSAAVTNIPETASSSSSSTTTTSVPTRGRTIPVGLGPELVPRPHSVPFQTFTPEDDQLMVWLHCVHGLPWLEIAPQYFPGRSAGTLNTRWRNKLKRTAKTILPEGFDCQMDLPEPLPQNTHATTKAKIANPGTRSFNVLKSDTDFVGGDSDASGSGRQSRNLRERQAVNYKLSLRPQDEFDDENGVDRVEAGAGAQDRPPFMHTARSTKPIEEPRSRRYVRKDRSPSRTKPYLDYKERELLVQGFEDGMWQPGDIPTNKAIHVDFDEAETKALRRVFRTVRTRYSATVNVDSDEFTQAQDMDIVWRALNEQDLQGRSQQSIESAILDDRYGKANDIPGRIALTKPRRKRHVVDNVTVSSVLRSRELGRSQAAGSIPANLQNRVFDTLGPSLSFTGMSNDVGCVAWAPDGVTFAAGAACHVDRDSMQYNRSNNLLLGCANGYDDRLVELPNHWLPRVRVDSGVNATHSMYASQDHRLFTTVSMVDFAPDGTNLYSSSYDSTVRVWDLAATSDTKAPSVAIPHEGRVDLLAVNQRTGLVGTGCQSLQNPIRIFKRRSDDLGLDEVHSFYSSRAQARTDINVTPSTLRWGTISSHLLLAGFSSNSEEAGSYGDLCLWDTHTGTPLSVLPYALNVFDCSWSPTRNTFAVACTAYSTNVNRGTRSVINYYDLHEAGSRSKLQLKCPAIDINDVVHCAWDPNLIAVGCTDGKTYIWDIRMPDNILHVLQHGEPLMELGNPAWREKLDTGIRFCSWGESRSRLFTGSSDGVLKSWDVYRAPEDILVQDIVTLNSGIFSGSFSHDFSKLLLGEINGSINVLEVGNADIDVKDAKKLRLQPAENSYENAKSDSEVVDPEGGITAARVLLDSKQMELRPMGALPIRQAVQGPNYRGPFDEAIDSRIKREEALAMQRRMEPEIQQCQIQACRRSNVLAPEEIGNSGRSKDRIPFDLRKNKFDSTEGDLHSNIIVPGRVKCAQCLASALPRVGEDPSNILCEACSFACFRCGALCQVYPKARGILCSSLSCGMEWQASVLGYELVGKQYRPDQTLSTEDRIPGVDRGVCFECNGELEICRQGAGRKSLECRACGLIVVSDVAKEVSVVKGEKFSRKDWRDEIAFE
ncbi:hypothetical protein K402DRAFT_389510 [Aulographum hederae CBS 113979]|uniref:Myb-like domain-containing protein n=1 Tax=Aulographum hederae CBS 113979 TaxID=1176131 RepID=A0A6G1HC10_9PEZI|nr:hypothetical protein K402DRAFT_389510 [Aulographum hederae CBS 113979]